MNEHIERMLRKIDEQIVLMNARQSEEVKRRAFVLAEFSTEQLETIKDFIESFG